MAGLWAASVTSYRRLENSERHSPPCRLMPVTSCVVLRVLMSGRHGTILPTRDLARVVNEVSGEVGVDSTEVELCLLKD